MAFSIKILGREILGFEKRSTGYTTQHIAQVVQEIMGTGTSAPVNESTAVKLTAFYRAVNLIAETISSIPYNVIKRQDEKRTIDYNHPVQRIVSRRPNPLMNSMQFRYAMTALALMRGGSYARIIRDARARPVELQVFSDPYKVRPFIYENRLFYHIAGEELPVPDENMFRILWTSFDGINPVSPIKAAAVAISKGLSAQSYGEQIFSAGGTRKIGIESPGKLGEEQRKNLSESWINEHADLKNVHKPAILEGGIKIVEIGIKPEEAQLLETENFTVEEIARLYGIPLHMLSSAKASGYNSNEQQNIEFNTYTMNPWYNRWEIESDDKLLYSSEINSHFINLDNTALLRGDSKARIEYMRGRFHLGSITPDEIRQREGDDPTGEPNAQKLFVQAQLVPLEIAGAKYAAEAMKNKTEKS